MTHVPVLDREEGKAFQPQTLTIVYASPTVRIRTAGEGGAGFHCASRACFCWERPPGWRRGGFGAASCPCRFWRRQAALVSTQSWKLQPPKEAEDIEELRPLTESMTQMLARLEYSFNQQREFVGNAAHELKTPVAVLKSTLQSLLQRPRNSEEYRAGVQASLQDLERLEQLLQWMLRLARAEQWAQNAQAPRARPDRHQLHLRRGGGENSKSGPGPQHNHSSRDQRPGSLPRRS